MRSLTLRVPNPKRTKRGEDSKEPPSRTGADNSKRGPSGAQVKECIQTRHGRIEGWGFGALGALGFLFRFRHPGGA
jgi:hypothetical protein